MFDYEKDIYRNMVHRAQIKEVLNNDGDTLQQVRASGYKGEEMECMRAQSHGFTSSPPVDSLGYAINLQGRKDLAIIIGGEKPGQRIVNKKSGEAALYYDPNTKVHAQEHGIRVAAKDKAHSVVIADNAQHRTQVGGYNIFVVKNLGNFRVLDKDSGVWYTPMFTASSAPPDDPTRD